MKEIKIKTVVIDDEVRALNRMKILLDNFPEIEIVAQTEDPFYGVDFILQNEPDLVLLDIEMPGKTGLEIADDINKNNLHTKIIFITAHDHYAIKAIKTSAFDYLLKPVGLDELKEAIDKANTEWKKRLN